MVKPPHDTLVPQRRGVEKGPVTFDDREGEIPFAHGTPAGADVPQLGVRSAPSP
jgi:hypothetical protein